MLEKVVPRVTKKISRDNILIGVSKNAFQWPFGCIPLKSIERVAELSSNMLKTEAV